MQAPRQVRFVQGSVLLAFVAATAFAHAAGDAAAMTGAEASPPSLGKRVDTRLLGRVRGGSDTVSQGTLTGTVTNNQAVDVSSGGNLIAGGAFAGASGVPVVIQNSGSNVLIQSATVITVNLK